MDAFELLKTDHEKVSQLFKKIESASGQAKRSLFTRLKNELDVHAHIEEKVLYPALENTEEARDITLEAYEEHKVVKDLLAELAKGGPLNDEWDAKLTVLKENVEHHVEEEEGDLFSKARKALSDDEIDRIGEELEAEKAKAQGATVKTSRAAKGKRSSTKAVSASTPASTGKSGSRRQSAKSRSGAESPGVLKRIANFIGLGDSSTSESKGRKKTTKAKSASKASSSKASGSKKPAKRPPVKAASGSKTKSAARRTGTKKAGKTKAGAKASLTQATSRANKRQSTSRGSKATTKAAARAGSKQRSSTKRKTTR